MEDTRGLKLKVLVCGDRHYSNRDKIRNKLMEYPEGTIIIEGGASGADSISAEIAKELGFELIEVKAEWEKYGKAAGPIRNKAMLELKPNIVLAFHDDIKNSRGTINMIKQAMEAGINEIILIDDKND